MGEIPGLDRRLRHGRWTAGSVTGSGPAEWCAAVGAQVEERRVDFFAAAPIAPGAELCFDYGVGYWLGSAATPADPATLNAELRILDATVSLAASADDKLFREKVPLCR